MLIGVCRPVPEVVGFVTPIFRDGLGTPVAQVVKDGRVVNFEAVELGEEFVPLEACVSAKIGDAALYAMQFEERITLASANNATMQDASAGREGLDSHVIRTAFEMHRNECSKGFISFPISRDADAGRSVTAFEPGHRETYSDHETASEQLARLKMWTAFALDRVSSSSIEPKVVHHSDFHAPKIPDDSRQCAHRKLKHDKAVIDVFEQ